MNLNHLNHSFEIINRLATWTDGKCEICGTYVYYSELHNIHFTTPSVSNPEGKLKLTCNEVLIKKLLE